MSCQSGNVLIFIFLVEPDGSQLRFTVETNMPLGALFQTHRSMRHGGNFIYLFGQIQIEDFQTANELFMENFDHIFVMPVDQTTIPDHVLAFRAKEITLFLLGQLRKLHVFPALQDTPLSEVFRQFCYCESLNYDHVKFVYRGRAIDEDQTPEMLGMIDCDFIDLVREDMPPEEVSE
jgi:hypothetical protein